MSETSLEEQSEPRPPARAEESRLERARRRAAHARLYASAIVLVVLLVVVVALIVSNTRHVKVSWVFGSTRISLVWLVLATAVFAWLLGIVTSVTFRRRVRPRR